MPATDAERGPLYTLAVVGSSPMARSVREALVERRFPFRDVRLLGSASDEVQITEFAGEPRLVGRAEPEALAGIDLAFFCEDPATGGAFRSWPEEQGYLAIDLTGARGEAGEPPIVDARRREAPPPPQRGWLAAAHPLAHLLATLLGPVERGSRLAAVHGVILRPASDFGKAGLEELYSQSVSLLNFAQVPREVFARQLAFNLIPGEALENGQPLAVTVAAQLRALLGRPDLSASLFFALAPVFHAHTALLHLEFEEAPAEEDLRRRLRAEEGLRVGLEPLTPVEAGEERRPHVGLIRRDPAGRGVWVWAVADHVEEAAADGAVALAERMLGIGARRHPSKKPSRRGEAET